MRKIILLLIIISVFVQSRVLAQAEKADKIKNRWYQLVSIHLDSVSLEEAILEIERLSGAKLNYNKNKIHSEKNISINLENEKLYLALHEILNNSDTQLAVTTNKQVAIVPQQVKSDDGDRSSGLTGQIEGVVTESTTGELLPGANIVVMGTNIGAASDISGKYHISKVPPGTYTLRVTYIGYKTKELTVKVTPGDKVTTDVELEYAAIEGEVIIISAQAEGQMKAINQQLSSLAITNVVAADRIQELPDATAAESVGRLPGVSINRSGGEANKVTVRGLAPKYNNVEIEGVRMGSTDMDDRSTDISMISPNALSGIEVTKALTPDMDANSLGGTINLTVQEARDEFYTDLLLQVGYDSQQESYDNYKFVGSVSNRFIEKKVGVYLNAYIEKRDRSTDFLNSDFQEDFRLPEQDRDQDLLFNAIEFTDQAETRERIGGTLVLDYRMPYGSLKFTNFGSRMNRKILTQRQSYEGEMGTHYGSNVTKSGDNFQTQVVNQLAGELDVFSGKLDVSLSHSLAERDQPSARGVTESGFYVLSQAMRDSLHYLDYVNNVGDFDAGGTDIKFSNVSINKYFGVDRSYTGQLNYVQPIGVGDLFSGSIKFGGKYIHQERKFDRELRRIDLDRNGYSQIGDKLFSLMPDVFVTRNKHFEANPKDAWDDHFDNSQLFGGKYNLKYFINLDVFDRLHDVAWSYYEQNGLIYNRSSVSFTKDQDGTEKTRAAYIMAEFKMLDNKITFIPGIRYEKVNYNYKGFIWEETGITEGVDWNAVTEPDTAETTHKNWFPMVHLRVKPTDWFDVRVAYTNTASRPNFTDLIPYLDFEPLESKAEGLLLTHRR
jgi:TonB-dependent receptor